MLPENMKDKSFWEKPENWTSVLLGAAVIAGGLWGLSAILPFLITLLENTLYTAFLGVATFATLAVVTNKKFWQLGGILLKRAGWHLTNWIITIDPIGILKDYVDGLRGKKKTMEAQISALSGKIRELKEKMSKNAKFAAENIRIATRAKKENKTATSILTSRRAGRRMETNAELQDVLTKMEILYRVINKMAEAVDFYIQDIDDQIGVVTDKYESIRSAHKAMKMAERIIKGDQDTELFMQTMDYLARDYGQKLGEIEQFINMSSSFIESVDIKNGMYEEDAMKLIEEWEKKGDSLILGDSKSSLIQQSYDAGDELDLDTSSAGARLEVKKTDFGKLFN